MKFYYIVNCRMPTEKAHGIQVMKMCEAFVKLGCDVELIVPARRNKISEDSFTYYTVPKTFKLTYLPTIDLVGTIPKIGFLIQHFSFLFAAKKYLRTKSGLIYSRDVFTNFFFSKTVLEVHTLPRNITFVHTFLYRRSKCIIVLTKKARDRLREHITIKSLVAPDAVDLNQFNKIIYSKVEARKKIGLPGDKVIIMYTGHLYPWKGIDVFIESMKSFNNNFLGIIVGGTPSDIAYYSRELALSGNVKVVGSVKHTTIPLYLKAADIAVLPNSGKFEISKWYTSPLKLFEYMASGVPIIASDLPSIREILDASTAEFCKPDDPTDLANSIRMLYFDEDRRRSIAERAKKVVRGYTWDKRALTIYDSFNKNQ